MGLTAQPPSLHLQARDPHRLLPWRAIMMVMSLLLLGILAMGRPLLPDGSELLTPQLLARAADLPQKYRLHLMLYTAGPRGAKPQSLYAFELLPGLTPETPVRGVETAPGAVKPFRRSRAGVSQQQAILRRALALPPAAFRVTHPAAGSRQPSRYVELALYSPNGKREARGYVAELSDHTATMLWFNWLELQAAELRAASNPTPQNEIVALTVQDPADS